jgi:hypothetical protein
VYTRHVIVAFLTSDVWGRPGVRQAGLFMFVGKNAGFLTVGSTAEDMGA